MTTKKTESGVFKNLPDSYEDLCLKIAFPRPIKDRVDYDNTLEIVERLMARRELTEGQTEYLEALTTFTERYEATEAPLPSVSSLEILQHLVKANEMSASELSKILGDETRSIGSRLLSGKRELSKSHIGTLAKHFGVSPSLFLRE